MKNFYGIVSADPEMLKIFETVGRLAAYNSNILISGESGTGKELLASAVHLASNRSRNKFIAVNCGAIPETLIESELFGHKKGAFTDATRDKKGLIEEAEGGTLFLDEISEMPLLLQVKLLRVLQQKEFRPIGDENLKHADIRLVAASNKDLDQMVKEGRFREDLFYRLNVVNLQLPALRNRKSDIAVLARYFCGKFSEKFSMPEKQISQAALQKLTDYSWPGNVRELENCLERLFLLSKGQVIELSDLPEQIISFIPLQSGDTNSSEASLSLKKNCEILESNLIKEALIRTSGNRTHAAKLLEISHRALLYKIKDYGLNEFMK